MRSELLLSSGFHCVIVYRNQTVELTSLQISDVTEATEYIVYDMEWTDRDLTMLNM